MKVAVFLLILAGLGVFILRSTMSSTNEGFDPTEQGREVRAILKTCSNWTEVLESADPPSKWRNDSSSFDFNYRDRFDETTRDLIAKKIEDDKLPDGFSFLYRFSDSVTFAVNFSRKGDFNNIQEKESRDDLMGG